MLALFVHSITGYCKPVLNELHPFMELDPASSSMNLLALTKGQVF